MASRKYNLGKRRIFIAGIKEAQNKPVSITDTDGNEVFEQIEEEVEKKQDAPTTVGSSGQLLGLDANGKPEWKTPSAGTTPDTEMSDSSTNAVQNKVVKAYADTKASIEALKGGDVVPAVASNIEDWEEQTNLNQNDTWDGKTRTTAGSKPIVSEAGGKLVTIVPKSDFKFTKLVTSPFNQLRLATNNGTAVALTSGGSTTGYYFPVPKLTFGEYGTAQENNGILFTDKDGANLGPTDITVRFQPTSSGAPTSVSDGTELTYNASTSKDTVNTNGGIWKESGKDEYFYITPGEGWLIVSGLTWAETCAHIAWENWYDRFIAPNSESDAGGSLDLSTLFSAVPNGTGKLLVLGSLHTKVEWTSLTQARITDPIARVASPSWTNTNNGDGTYTHSLTISPMKSNGAAVIEGQTQTLTVDGTTVSYIDDSATALSGAVRYEKSSVATATVNVAPTFSCNDCGIEMLTSPEGEAYIKIEYACNIVDWLAEFAKSNNLEDNRVISEAFASLSARIDALALLLLGEGGSHLDLTTRLINTQRIRKYGVPDVLESSVAGAPSDSNVPDNWDASTMGAWTGVGRFIGQLYVVKRNPTTGSVVKGAVYMNVGMNNSTADWLLLAQES